MLIALLLLAQWLDHPDRNIPRAKDGKPVLTAKAPKTRDGRPDLSGIWLPDNTPGVKGTNGEPLPRHFISVTFDMKNEDVPFTPEGAAAFRRNLAGNGKDDPGATCHPMGMPSVEIFIDGRTHVETTIPSWLGYSVGHWEGDALVVETTGFNDKSWLDRIGHAHSDQMRVVEKFRRKDLGHLDVSITIDDPKTFTRPISYTQPNTLTPDGDLLEYFCTDNEQDSAHFK